jgi:hypothetical protein
VRAAVVILGDQGLWGHTNARSLKDKTNIDTITCYICGGKGHFASSCSNKQQATQAGPATTNFGNVICYKCGSKGHLANACSDSKTTSDSNQPGILVCYACRQRGHRAHECPTRADRKQVLAMANAVDLEEDDDHDTGANSIQVHPSRYVNLSSSSVILEDETILPTLASTRTQAAEKGNHNMRKYRVDKPANQETRSGVLVNAIKEHILASSPQDEETQEPIKSTITENTSPPGHTLRPSVLAEPSRAEQAVRFQRPLPPLLLPETNKSKRTAPRDTRPICLMQEKNVARFDVGDLLRATDVTLPIAQLLDRSPQIRTQLARYLKAARSTAQKKNGKGQNITATVAQVDYRVDDCNGTNPILPRRGLMGMTSLVVFLS